MFDVILFSDSPIYGKNRGHGAHTISSHIRERGYSCLVIDHAAALTYDLYTKLLDLAIGENTIVVGYSTTWFNGQWFPLRHQNTLSNAFANHTLRDWFAYPKQINPNLKLVLGGARTHTFINADVDYIIRGLGETMFTDLLNTLSGKDDSRTFDRIIDYDMEAKDPCWDFRESVTTYTEFDIVRSEDPLTMEVGRGCRFKCKFCSYPLIGRKNVSDYLRYPEKVRKELIDNYEQWGTTQYYIIDDTFNDSVEKIEMMVNVTRSLPFKPEYWAFTRLDLTMAFPETIPMLLEMGMKHTYIGVETFDEMAGKVIGKGMSRERRMFGLQQLKDCWGDEINVQSGFMVGLPHENQDSIQWTADYLNDPNCPVHNAFFYPLFLKGPGANTKYMSKSTFDIEHEKYGYSFPDPSNMNYWEKNDGSDIVNYFQATEIAQAANNQVQKTFFPGFVHAGLFEYPKYKGLDRITIGSKEYGEAIHHVPTIMAAQHKVMETYFKPLVAKLESKRQVNWRLLPEDFEQFRPE